MAKYIIIFNLLLLVSLKSPAQLSNLVDPIRKSEEAIKAMMKNYKATNEFYSKQGKIIHFEYNDYILFFTLNNFICTKVEIFNLKKKGGIDSEMYEWLYMKEYESAGEGKNLWGKMIPITSKSGEKGTYPVSVIKTDATSWSISDMLKL